MSLPALEDKNGHLPAQLIGDEVRLKQVLVNLTKNALKFSPLKQIDIQASYSAENEMLTVHIIDQGKGI